MGTHYDALFIGGEWVPPSSADTIRVISASTGHHIGTVAEAREADVDAAVDAARQAFEDPDGWSHWAPARRADCLERLARILEVRAEEMAIRVSAQNGMPIAVSQKLEAMFAPLVLRYYAGLIGSAATEELHPHLLGGTTVVRREPIGVVGAIAPWNFPQTLAAFKHAPALAAGCTVVLKPARQTVLDSVLFAEAVDEAGLPPGVLSVVPGGREIGAHLVAHPDIDMVAFSGTTAAGRQVAETCGRLLRPVTLQLGGKSAAIVLDDAELDLATVGDRLFGATLLNNGQTSYLGTRILAPRSRYEEVVEFFATLARSLVVGDALDPSTQIGPMATEDHRAKVETYVAKGIAEGARLVVGGGRPSGVGGGWFVEPTVFADVDNNHAIAQQEILGPVLSIIGYDDEDDAVRLANDSDYGLGGSVWTTDPERGFALARRIRTGTIGVNTYLPDPGSPFGGVKASGIGRELGPDAIGNFQQLKSIYR